MERSLRNRLTFGSMMLLALFGLLGFDHFAQVWTREHGYNAPWGIGGIGIMIFLMAIAPYAILEMAQLLTAEQVRPYRIIAAAGAGAMVIHAFATQFKRFQPIAASTLAFIVVSIMLAAALRRALGRETQQTITRMAGSVLAAMYLGGLSWFIVALRVKHSYNPDRIDDPHHFQGTTMVIFMILLSVKSTDIGAYFGGRKFGKHKLIPWLSPGKTWEGLFFGLLTAGIVGAVCGRWINPPVYHLPWWKGFIFGVIIGGIGQVGDLLESAMKRDAEVKDSGAVVPGFGGVLDIIDSPLLAGPVAYLLFSLF